MSALLFGIVLAGGVSGCASSQPAQTGGAVPPALLAQVRPIGRGPRFHPAVTGHVPGPCRRRLGPRFGAHVEVFAANRVVLLPAGIGVRRPRPLVDGRLTAAGCYGTLVTLDPTGVVQVRSGARANVAELFRAWGEALSPQDLVGFQSGLGHRVAAFVNGRPWTGSPGSIPLTRHAEIVLEVGPHVPPHHSYTFSRGL